jgi:hypothetical protein
MDEVSGKTKQEPVVSIESLCVSTSAAICGRKEFCQIKVRMLIRNAKTAIQASNSPPPRQAEKGAEKGTGTFMLG